MGYPAGIPEAHTEAPRASAAPSGVRVAGAVGANPGPSDAGRTYEVFGVRYQVMESPVGFTQEGLASWYGEDFHGKPTASGEPFDMHGYSAAHRTLPLHTWVEVRNLENGRALILRVNDRGPFAHTDRRILDLSYGAARELGVVTAGTARIRLRALDPREVEGLR